MPADQQQRERQPDRRQEFVRLVLANPVNAVLLDRLAELDLPDCYLVAGCLFQSVWNGLTGRPPIHGILDYDVFYFDPSDTSWEAEDSIIRRCSDAFADLGVEVQVRNQARVHLWYPQKHGVEFPPLRSSRDGIDGFLNQSGCVGMRQTPQRDVEIYSTFGFDDLFRMVVRPNCRNNVPDVYYEKTGRWQKAWPELTVIPWPENVSRPFALRP